MPKLSSYTFESWHVLAALFTILCVLIFFINDAQTLVDAKQDLEIINIEEHVDELKDKKLDKDQYRIDIQRIFDQLKRIETRQINMIGKERANDEGSGI